MKSITIKIILLMSCFHFQSVIASEKIDSEDKICRNVEAVARNAMETRQNGVPLTKTIEIFKQTTTGGLKLFAEAIAIEAYKQPVITNEKEREKAIKSFANKWTVYCYETQLNKKIKPNK